MNEKTLLISTLERKKAILEMGIKAALLYIEEDQYPSCEFVKKMLESTIAEEERQAKAYQSKTDAILETSVRLLQKPNKENQSQPKEEKMPF